MKQSYHRGIEQNELGENVHKFKHILDLRYVTFAGSVIGTIWSVGDVGFTGRS